MLLTREDLARHPRSTWASLAALLAVAVGLRLMHRGSASDGTFGALAGCLALVLPPRERMVALPARLRALPRSLDAAPVWATVLSSPGYGLNWFYGANPYDEVVHLVSGLLAGAVFAGLIRADGLARSRRRMALLVGGLGLALGVGWECFEAATGLIGDWTDTWTDVALTMAGAALAGALSRPVPAG